jgi:hypothetical protein
MDKLEQYLDQVCRGIGGPRSLRQHLRQELREHLLDAAAEHKRAGLPEEEALARALDDFGGPDQVRSELEATHGHRLLPVVIDKAMQWKERTMKAKWLWTTWAHLALAGVIGLELIFLLFAIVFLVPKFESIARNLGYNPGHERVTSWVPSFLHSLNWVEHNLLWFVLLPAGVWMLFEWRMHSENKLFMRLSALGTAALGLMLAVAVTGFALVVPLMLLIPDMDKGDPAPAVIAKQASIDTSVSQWEQSLANKNWPAVEEYASQASYDMDKLAHMGAAPLVLASLDQQAKVDDVRTQLKAANAWLQEAQQASREKDVERLTAALRKFHGAYKQVRKVAPK